MGWAYLAEDMAAAKRPMPPGSVLPGKGAFGPLGAMMKISVYLVYK